jgi:hypothetical protein
MDGRGKQRTVTKLLLLEGYASGEIVIHLLGMDGSPGYCCASVFRWISEVRCGDEELRNERRSGRPFETKLMRIFGQFYKKT